MSVDTEGLSRARSKETNNQSGGKSGTKVKVTTHPKSVKSNPKKGGGINRSLAGRP